MSKKQVMALVAGVVVFMTLIGAGVAYFLIKDRANQSEQSPTMYTYAIEDYFVTNVKDSNKLFKTSVVLVLNKEGMDTVMKENLPVIRDKILFILRELTAEDLANPDIQNKLRDKIPTALNEAMGIDYIVSVYFGDFVMQ